MMTGMDIYHGVLATSETDKQRGMAGSRSRGKFSFPHVYDAYLVSIYHDYPRMLDLYILRKTGHA